MNLETIAPSQQKDVISSFWTMLKECESKAEENNDPVLKHWVKSWHKQWNEITGADQKPRWEK